MTFLLLSPALQKAIRRIRGAIVRLAIKLANGKCGKGLRVEAGFRLKHGFHNGLEFGESVYLGRNTTIDCPVGARTTIGSNVTLTSGVYVSAANSVSIADDVLIGEYVSIRDANHSFDDLTTPIRSQSMDPGPITIGKNSWIGRGACILRGVAIAQGTVVGANAVVTRSTEENGVYAGAPARLVRFRGKV